MGGYDAQGSYWEGSTSATGVATVPQSVLGDLHASTPGWCIPPQGRDEIEEVGELWCYRSIPLTGTIEGPTGPTRHRAPFRLTAYFEFGISLDPSTSPGNSAATTPWSTAWFNRHSILLRQVLGESDVDGNFRFTIPRIRGLRLRAISTGGNERGQGIVSLDSRTECAEARITTGLDLLVKGRLVNSRSEPVGEGATVELHMMYTIPPDQVDLGEIRRWGEAVSVVSNPAKREARVQVSQSVRVDEAGRFSIQATPRGNAVLSIYAGGFTPVRIRLGEKTGLQDLGDIRVGADGSSSAVEFRYRGRALVGHSVYLAECVDQGLLLLPVYQLDRSGRFPLALLQRDHRYFVDIQGSLVPKEGVHGYWTFDGSDIVELCDALQVK
jgi:hypothetical protein